MKLTPTLTFNGNCEEAFRFYAELLHATRTAFFPYANFPQYSHLPANWQPKILHANFTFSGITIAGGDALPGTYTAPQGISLRLDLTDPAEAERLYLALSPNAQIKFPLQPTFWASHFAVLTDQYGTPWEINCR